MVFPVAGVVRNWCLQLGDGVAASRTGLPWALAPFLTLVSICLASPQPATTACGLWRRRRRTPSGCWGRARWCCLTRSSAASAKTCTSSVPDARYGAARRHRVLVWVSDSFTASSQALALPRGGCLSPSASPRLKGLGSEGQGGGTAGPRTPFSCHCSQCRALCPSL